jgi:hypothetical protein
MVTALAERATSRMDEAHGYHLGREDGTPGLVDRMWQVAPHEVGRLPMIYGVAWELTGDPRWQALYRRYAGEAAEQARALRPETCCVYAIFQHQVSLEVLWHLAADDAPLRAAWQRLMTDLADYAATLAARTPEFVPVDLATLDLDWRRWPRGQGWYKAAGYEVPVLPPAVTELEFRPLRECGEALLIQLLCPARPLPAAQAAILTRLLTTTAFARCFTYAMIYPLAAGWRAAGRSPLRPPASPPTGRTRP